MNCLICGTKLKGKDLRCPKCKFDMSEEALPSERKDPYQLRVFEPDYYVDALQKKFDNNKKESMKSIKPDKVSDNGAEADLNQGSGSDSISKADSGTKKSDATNLKLGSKPKKHPLRWIGVILLIIGVGLFVYDNQTNAVRNYLVQYPAFSFLNKEQVDVDDSADINGDVVTDEMNDDEYGIDDGYEDTIVDQLLDEDGIHYYEFIVDDVSWGEAFNDCISYGGYLARINTLDEFNYITSALDEEGLDDIHFFIGGRRNPGESDYQWVDRNNTFTGVVINDNSYWTDGHWMSYEPSYKDGDTEEDVLCLVKYEGAWRLNDVPNNTLAYASFYSGQIGYICEYEE